MNSSPPTIRRAIAEHWKREAADVGRFLATTALLSKLWEFLRDSTPSRLRQRYGDADFDWDHHVNTTSAAVGWHDRLLGVLHSPYQPTDPNLFREMLDDLKQRTAVDFASFTFLDLGSGKGRTLLLASDYPFEKIIGVELLPSLHAIARQNLQRYQSDSQKCFAIEPVCADATTFPLPPNPLLIYLFNPFPEAGLRHFLANLEKSLRQHPRAAYLLYHNPLLEHVLLERTVFHKIGGTHQYSIFSADLCLLPDTVHEKNPG
jgi:SAM-dependent methyltransferase